MKGLFELEFRWFVIIKFTLLVNFAICYNSYASILNLLFVKFIVYLRQFKRKYFNSNEKEKRRKGEKLWQSTTYQ